MTLRKAVYEVACDTNGIGTDTVHLRPSIATRRAALKMVTLERRYAAESTGTERIGFGQPTITLSELDDVSDETWNESDEETAIGRQLFFADTKANINSALALVDEWDPKHAAVTLRGELPTYDVMVGDELIHTDKVLCEINGANSGDYFKVTMYYETAGDYRF